MQESDPLDYATPPIMREFALARSGNTLLVRDGTNLPRLCILCGLDQTTKSIQLTFTYDDSFHVTHKKSTLELRQSGTTRAHLCQKHFQRWFLGRFFGIAGVLLSALAMLVGLILIAFSENSDIPSNTSLGIAIVLISFATLILSLFIFSLRTRTLTCTQIENGILHLNGAGPIFLDAISESNEPPAIH
jgi:hypothetical protein